MDSSYHPARMPSGAAAHVCRTLGALQRSSPDGDGLSAAAYQQILLYCGMRPDRPAWRRFLLAALTLLGLLALVSGGIFFIAWNWAAMPKMAKFALVEGGILALTVVVWWRWRQTLARMALLAIGLSFGGLLALYGQTYQTGADSWELFRAWTLILLPLALLGRQNGLWICTWAVANLAFQFYYANQALLLGDDAWQQRLVGQRPAVRLLRRPAAVPDRTRGAGGLRLPPAAGVMAGQTLAVAHPGRLSAADPHRLGGGHGAGVEQHG